MYGSKRMLVFGKVSNLLSKYILIPKLKKPFIAKQVLLKKLRKQKELKLLQHYNNPYGYYKEYEISPSSTPLIHYYHGKQFKSRRRFWEFYSFVFLCRCMGQGRKYRVSVGESQLNALSSVRERGIVMDMSEPLDSGDEEDSVDLRAEKFIAKFYQEMRMQRRQSF